jgi:hypothetical protein
MMKKYKYEGETQFGTIDDINQALREAIGDYKNFRPKAEDYRDSYLGRIANELAEIDGKSALAHFTRIKNEEKIKAIFRRIKYCEGRIRKGGVDRVEITTDQGPEIKYGKLDIENAIMTSNKEKLLQAHNTPFRSELLQELVGEQENYEKWESILNRGIQLPEITSEETKAWFSFIQNYERDGIEPIKWNTDEYIATWKKMADNKASVPGIQAAHIKCLTSKMQSATVLSLLALIPLICGYSPTRWRVGIDSMIPKKQDDLRPSKLRLILLMDTRFNHNNKLIGKKMMEYAEKKDC